MVEFAEIQGIILAPYRMKAVRHFVLRVDNARGARDFIGSLVSGSAAIPQITTADKWDKALTHRLNIGITHDGLRALGLPQRSLDSFPDEYKGGALGATQRVGDTGDSGPARWDFGLGTGNAHVLLTLYASGADEAAADAELQARSATLDILFEEGGAFEVLGRCNGKALPKGTGGKVHFGYEDGIAQPTIKDGPPVTIPCPQPEARLGDFVLGHNNSMANNNGMYEVPIPDELGKNGSFAAFRVLEQDVAEFEKFLETWSARLGVTKEWVAAKVCGRWRSGVPLALSPERDDPGMAREVLNNFDYVPTAQDRNMIDDTDGLRCPIGAHIRRTNPRSQRVAGGEGFVHKHRIIRRGMPYGPPFDPDNPDDGKARGLLGLFICGSLGGQFELIMREWVNSGDFTNGLDGTKEPMVGDFRAGQNRFLVPTAAGQKVLDGFASFVTTRGGAYCFLPSVTALKHIANL